MGKMQCKSTDNIITKCKKHFKILSVYSLHIKNKSKQKPPATLILR